MKTVAKTALACVAGALLIHFGWSQFAAAKATEESSRQARQVESESRRQLSMEEMEGYLLKGEDRKREHVRLHRGEPVVAGLSIGMTREEAKKALPGGADDVSDRSTMRFPHSSVGQEVVAKFVGDELCFAAVVPSGTSSSSVDLDFRYAEPKDDSQRVR